VSELVAKIKLDSNLYERVKKVAELAGYPTADEFIVHVIEKELSMLETAESDEEVTERLKGLGYIE
jgi:predicted DNA-binding protein